MLKGVLLTGCYSVQVRGNWSVVSSTPTETVRGSLHQLPPIHVFVFYLVFIKIMNVVKNVRQSESWCYQITKEIIRG